ncbi:hypothetical protein G6M70_04245 [Agrobacterium tumefaciens]|uniref:hypothetical protein n=1 Tax=Agrobacterium tumefaciens TaxID=358 RepID=UPI00157329B8|nr:hypothetical protein [Agrobacterium tumefaciens]NSY99764.1 hypothetical protein [Agrobacterium tumefaciens]NSZ38169.1 hypothetical protein [Agrobacterium tumefaciens]NTB22042.1 hypothetical protein [Agrobacterium tumefaciens]NTB31892.1 hypothetical protein [Agrobacterium tumefaciens]NTB36471.1 hypothetical protein [Agrobacterium tumefaciens]
MDAQTINQWLLARGFNLVSSGTYESAYGVYKVRVALLAGKGCTSVHKQNRKRDLASFGFDQVRTDRHGMLRGAGLDEFFIYAMKAGNPAPKWFPDNFRRAVYSDAATVPLAAEKTATRSAKKLSTSARAMRWARDNGFERVGPCTFHADYADSTVEFHVGTKGVVTHMTTGFHRDLLMRTPLRSIWFDSTGMIRGAGLDDWFVKEMEIGGEPPIWFNKKFMAKLEASRDRPSFR